MLKVTDEVLSAYTDGDLSEADRVEVEKALERSAQLRRQLEELRSLQQLASDLAMVPPARDLWPSIRDRVISPHPWWMPRLAWVPAVAMLVLVIAPALYGPWSPSKDAPAETARQSLEEARQSYKSAIAAMEVSARKELARLSPGERKVLEASWAEVDAAIARVEEALSRASEDVWSHRMLLALYDEKIRVLNASLEAAAGEEESG